MLHWSRVLCLFVGYFYGKGKARRRVDEPSLGIVCTRRLSLWAAAINTFSVVLCGSWCRFLLIGVLLQDKDVHISPTTARPTTSEQKKSGAKRKLGKSTRKARDAPCRYEKETETSTYRQ